MEHVPRVAKTLVKSSIEMSVRRLGIKWSCEIGYDVCDGQGPRSERCRNVLVLLRVVEVSRFMA